MKTFPVDEVTLSALRTALDNSLCVNDSGDIVRRNGFGFEDLLTFLSGPQAESVEGGVTLLERTRFSPHDVIRALLDEVESLRVGGAS
jgi:hypothetical protein